MEPIARRDFPSDGPSATESLGRWLGERVEAGLVLDLRGPLGSGKTQFVRGLALGLGVAGGVRSPTFTICHVHEGRVPLYHLDAYRVAAAPEFLRLGWDDMCTRGVVAVEWGERVAELLPASRLLIRFEHTGAATRRIRVEGRGGRAAALAAGLPATLAGGPDPARSAGETRKSTE